MSDTRSMIENSNKILAILDSSVLTPREMVANALSHADFSSKDALYARHKLVVELSKVPQTPSDRPNSATANSISRKLFILDAFVDALKGIDFASTILAQFAV